MFNEVERIVRSDETAVLMLADIGAIAFSDLIYDIPERAMNIGIFEAGMVSYLLLYTELRRLSQKGHWNK